MRLQHITSDRPQDQQLRLLGVEGDRSVSYLFIESVRAGGLLSEAGSNQLVALMRAGIAKLQNFMTPDASTDLDAMLAFMAPTGGGIAKVKSLVAKAKELEGPLLQDDNWWSDMFDAFSIKDPAVRDEVKKKVGVEMGQGKDEDPMETLGGMSQEDDRHGVSASIAAMKKQRAGHVTPAPVPMAEAILSAVAVGLMNEGNVRSNLKFVASNVMRRLGAPTNTSWIDDDWLDKFMRTVKTPVREGFGDFARDARNFFTNPEYSAGKLNKSAGGESNQRAAKLAVQLLFDRLKSELHQRLQIANLTMKDMKEALETWGKLQMQYTSGTRSPQLVAELQQAFAKMKQILFAVNPDLAKQSFTESSLRKLRAICA